MISFFRTAAMRSGRYSDRGECSPVAAESVGTPLLRAVVALRSSLRRWAVARKEAAEDNEFWTLALMDHRVMSDISRDVSPSSSRAMNRMLP